MSGANPDRGEVAITLAGQEIVLRPTFDAIAKIRAATGVPFGQSYSRIAALDVVEMATVLGACARAAGSTLKDEQVGELIMREGVAAAVEKATALLGNILTGGSKPREGEAAAAETAKSPSAA